MAGNIVKWWKHKILGGYKQFTVLQECATDSEELIYPMRAQSACSAPPDLLLTSEREQIISVKVPSKHHQNSHHKQQKENIRRNSQKNGNNDQDHRIRLEEFTCDVSLEDSKKPQPLQFSFTLYDLDGYGKITKDDIAGIVSTIYESIGKSVVVPHYGSKTINVRLTVSPDGRTKASNKKAAITPRRRYRPRKILSDDDGSDTSENCPRIRLRELNNSNSINNNIKDKDTNLNNRISKDSSATTATGPGTSATTTCFESNLNNNNNNTNNITKQNLSTCPNKNLSMKNENIYESINNLKCCNLQQQQQMLQISNSTPKKCCPVDVNSSCPPIAECNNMPTIICRECTLEQCHIDENPIAEIVATKQNLVKRKTARKSRSSRKQKMVDEHRPRARSLSVGNENIYQNVEENQEECWQSSLRRNELIEIIRESMVKNSLCFQPNRKPLENSPKHRNRSHTISKMVSDQVFLNQTDPTHITSTTTTGSPLAHETNLCGYDSYLHKTICTSVNANHTALHVSTTSASPLPLQSTPNRLLHSHKSKRKESRFFAANSRHQVPVKLSTALLTQLNPNLSAEQKLSRTIDQVEKWLDNKDKRLLNKLKAEERQNKLRRTKSKEEINLNKKLDDNVLTTDVLLDKLKITEDVAEAEVVTPKKAFNKECLISSATRKNIKTHQQSMKSNDILNKNKNIIQIEYDSVPVSAEPIECENLLRTSDVDDEHHQNNGEHSVSSAATTATSSTAIHRYVHEHIHHHYHHFEDDDES